jgi:hypothetical protein
MLCPKFYTCNLYIYIYIYTPPKEEECTTYTILGYPQLDLVFCDEPIKDVHHKGKTFAGWLGVPTTN